MIITNDFLINTDYWIKESLIPINNIKLPKNVYGTCELANWFIHKHLTSEYQIRCYVNTEILNHNFTSNFIYIIISSSPNWYDSNNAYVILNYKNIFSVHKYNLKKTTFFHHFVIINLKNLKTGKYKKINRRTLFNNYEIVMHMPNNIIIKNKFTGIRYQANVFLYPS